MSLAKKILEYLDKQDLVDSGMHRSSLEEDIQRIIDEESLPRTPFEDMLIRRTHICPHGFVGFTCGLCRESSR